MPHVWNGWTRATLTQADEIVITATPELANLRNAKNIVDMLKKLRPNDPPPKLIINQAGVPKRPEITAADFAEPLGITPMAVIPFEPLFSATPPTTAACSARWTPNPSGRRSTRSPMC